MKKLSGLYIAAAALGCFLTLTELILSAMNSSLCSSTGCRVVESYLRFNESFMYIMGFSFFAALLIAERVASLRKYGALLLLFALAAEGYLIGFQIFVAGNICSFCFVVASFIAFLALIKFFSGAREPILVGCLLFALIFSAVYSINASSEPIPSGSQYVLIYSGDCPHCEEVISFAKEKSIKLTLQDVKEVKGAMRAMGLNAVPVLVCNDPDGKKIYSGAANIIAILTSRFCPENNKQKIQPASAQKSSKAKDATSSQKMKSNDASGANSEPVANTAAPSNQSGPFGGVCDINKKSDPCK
jgi:uncharacterized membrane protein/glutaredoxin